jgi:hypothetical protein
MVSACLVPKKKLEFAQTQIIRLQIDSLAMEGRWLTAEGTVGSTQDSLEVSRTKVEQLHRQLAESEAALQEVSLGLDSMTFHQASTSVARDVWRIEALRAKRRMERAEFVRDSLQEVVVKLKTTQKPRR